VSTAPAWLRVPVRWLGAVWARPWTGFAAVFACALWQRWHMPWLPLATADSWGFLGPALYELGGEGFRQTHGRSIAYPLFLLSVLRAAESFPAIAVIQHALGLASGLVWIWVFSLWTAWLPEAVRSRPWVWWIGVFALGLYLLGACTVVYETTLRPESIFPLFAFLQIGCTLTFLRARWAPESGGRAILFGSLSLLCAVVCVSLKPSWGFAAAVPVFALLLGIVARGQSSLRYASCLALACGVVLVVVWQKAVPWTTGWINDNASITFLPATLFTVHADLISKTMHEDAARGLLSGEEKDFLVHLDQRLAESRNTARPKYKVLGHDPDYLMYHSDTLTVLPGDADAVAEHSAEYFRAAYFSAWRAQPLGMLRKVGRQVWHAHRNAEATLHCASFAWRTHFENASGFSAVYRPPELPGRLAEGWRGLFAECEKLARSEASHRSFAPAMPIWFNRGFLSVLLAFFVAAGAFVLPVGGWFFRRPVLVDLAPAARIFSVIVITHLGMVVTVAVVHSFDIRRYLALLSPSLSLVLATGSGLLVAMLWVAWQSRFRSWRSSTTTSVLP